MGMLNNLQFFLGLMNGGYMGNGGFCVEYFGIYGLFGDMCFMGFDFEQFIFIVIVIKNIFFVV